MIILNWQLRSCHKLFLNREVIRFHYNLCRQRSKKQLITRTITITASNRIKSQLYSSLPPIMTSVLSPISRVIQAILSSSLFSNNPHYVQKKRREKQLFKTIKVTFKLNKWKRLISDRSLLKVIVTSIIMSPVLRCTIFQSRFFASAFKNTQVFVLANLKVSIVCYMTAAAGTSGFLKFYVSVFWTELDKE